MDLRLHDVEARDEATLNLWERSPPGASQAVCFVHGSITNARALFAPPVEDSDTVRLVGVADLLHGKHDTTSTVSW